MRAILIPPDFHGSVREITLSERTNEQLTDLRAFVGGDIEAVAWSHPGTVGYINETGKFAGLGYNSRASVLFLGILRLSDHIAGPMVLTGQDEDGDLVDLDSAITPESLMGIFRTRTRT